MKIVHAVSNELGLSIGGQPGDQTGKEIRKAEWYDRPWDVYIECTDEYLADKAAWIAEKIAAGNFGYSQSSRWSGFKAIQKVGVDHLNDASAGDFDCSSLVLSCYILAGLDIKASGYTQTLEKILLKTGKFESYRDDEHVKSCRKAKRGSLYLMPGKHVIMCIPVAKKVKEEKKPFEPYVQVIHGSIRVREEANRESDTVGYVTEGAKLPYLAEENGWYKVNFHGAQAYVTGNFRYTKLVTEEQV